MQITYELTQQDFVEAFLAHRNSKRVQKWALRFLLFFACLMLAGAIFTLITQRNSAALANVAPLVVLTVFWFWLYWGAIRWTARKQFNQQPGAHGPRTLTLDDQGMHWRWNGGSGDVEWNNYVRWLDGKNQFLFYTSPACFNILPKRALSEEQLQEGRELFARNIRAVK